MTQTLINTAKTLLTSRFGTQAETAGFAPGRVNLLGEHTDYNGGYVLPTPLNMGIAVAIARTQDKDHIQITSDAFPDPVTRPITDQPNSSWSDYILGAIAHFAPQISTGLQVAVATNLPVGSGLSSSAALIVSTMRAVADLVGADLSDVEIAQAAHTVENDFVGLPCGVMDQFVSSVGTAGQALFLDTATLDFQLKVLPKSHSFVIIHSGVGHKLTDDGYKTRVAECTAACRALGVATLSALRTTDAPRYSALPDPLAQRVSHVVTENQRVLDAVAALDAGDVAALGELMTASHASQRDDYAVSVRQVDALVQGAIDAGAAGARLTGGGFGGSIVALVATEQTDAFTAQIAAQHPDAKLLAIV